MVNLVVDCLRSRTSLNQLTGVWQALERIDTQSTPFSSWLWADAWWREFGDESSRLRIIIVKNGKEVVGICPLVLQTTKHYRFLPVTTLSLLGALPGIQPTHPGVIAHPKFRQWVEGAVMGHLPNLKGWDTLDLNGMEVDASFAVLARERLRKRGAAAAVHTNNELPHESLLCSWADYRLGGGGQRALELQRLHKTVTGLGTGSDSCELSLCSTRQDLLESQTIFFSMNRGVSTKIKSADDTAAARERFFKTVVPEFFVADLLWQLTLKIDGNILGVQHYFIWRGDMLLFQEAYAPQYQHTDLAKFMVAYAIKRGIGQAFRRIRVHTRFADFSAPFICKFESVSHLRFTPSATSRVVDKILKKPNRT